MKSIAAVSISAIALACSSSTSAFVPAKRKRPLHHTLSRSSLARPVDSYSRSASVSAPTSTTLSPTSEPSEPSRREAIRIAAGVLTGWVLGPRIEIAHAAGAYQPESGYDATDLSMPTYTVENNLDTALGGITSTGGSDSDSAPLKDPEKEAARQAKLSEKKRAAQEKEAAKVRAYYEKMKAKEAKDAEKARIKAEVAAGRAAMREAKLKSKIPPASDSE